MEIALLHVGSEMPELKLHRGLRRFRSPPRSAAPRRGCRRDRRRGGRSYEADLVIMATEGRQSLCGCAARYLHRAGVEARGVSRCWPLPVERRYRRRTRRGGEVGRLQRVGFALWRSSRGRGLCLDSSGFGSRSPRRIFRCSTAIRVARGIPAARAAIRGWTTRTPRRAHPRRLGCAARPKRGLRSGGHIRLPTFLVAYFVAVEQKRDVETIYRSYGRAGWGGGGTRRSRGSRVRGRDAADRLPASRRRDHVLWRGTARAELREQRSPDAQRRVRELRSSRKVLVALPARLGAADGAPDGRRARGGARRRRAWRTVSRARRLDRRCARAVACRDGCGSPPGT